MFSTLYLWWISHLSLQMRKVFISVVKNRILKSTIQSNWRFSLWLLQIWIHIYICVTTNTIRTRASSRPSKLPHLLLCSHALLPPTITPGNLYHCHLSFQECCINRILQYATFWPGFPPLAWCLWDELEWRCSSVVSSFLQLPSIPLHGCTRVCLSTHLLKSEIMSTPTSLAAWKRWANVHGFKSRNPCEALGGLAPVRLPSLETSTRSGDKVLGSATWVCTEPPGASSLARSAVTESRTAATETLGMERERNEWGRNRAFLTCSPMNLFFVFSLIHWSKRYGSPALIHKLSECTANSVRWEQLRPFIIWVVTDG